MTNAKLILLWFTLIGGSTIQAQTLFTYGSKSVDAKEFIRSYRKNATGTETDSAAIRSYLEPFIRYKLKVQAALDLKMDTLPNQLSDLSSFMEQIKPLYLLHTATLDSLIRLAHERTKWVIEVAHQFIPKVMNASTDTSFQPMGFITALSLPAPFEDAIYSVNDGAITSFIESTDGFHRFKRINSKKNDGKRSVFHLLVAVPDGATLELVAERRRLADSLHQLVSKGASIAQLAVQFSDDKSSAPNGGLIEGVGVGQFDPLFESAVFALVENGSISPVFQTDFGFHIVQLAEIIPVPEKVVDSEFQLREELLQDDRHLIAEEELIRKSIGKFGLTADTKDKKGFISERLAQFNPSFAEQIREFRDGNLLFEIMDKMVWRKATSDQSGLFNYYLKNKSTYSWQSSLNITTITSINRATAELLRNTYLAERSAEQIRKLYSEVALVDTGRYERTDIALLDGVMPYEGYVSDLRTNESDSSVSFVVIDKIHKDPSSKTFEEAKGQVINHYQEYLENRWIESLKKKYPIKMNQKTWETILRQADQNTLLTAL